MFGDRPRSADSQVRNSSTSSGGRALDGSVNGQGARERARVSSPMIDLASVSSPARSGRGRRRAGPARSVMCSSSIPCSDVVDRSQVRCRGRRGSARRRSPASCRTRTAARPSRPEADLLGQLASGGLLGRLAVDVADPGRDLEQVSRRAAARYWRTSTTGRRRAAAPPRPRPGWCTTSRSKVGAVGRRRTSRRPGR